MRPAIAAGFTASAANAYTGGELPSAHVQTFGAETELGLQLYARDGAPTTWIFASATYAGRSERGSLGVNFARTEARHWSCPSKNRCNAVVGLLAPQQLEIVVETDAGLPRYGGMFSWGI